MAALVICVVSKGMMPTNASRSVPFFLPWAAGLVLPNISVGLITSEVTIMVSVS